jgi:NAD+ kinase
MRHGGQDKQSKMKFHFSASDHNEAQSRLAEMTTLYGQTPIESATHVIALGGDGHMLHVLHDCLPFNLPVFGMNCGHVGFLMNDFSADRLPERIAAAEVAPIHPLRMTATATDGAQTEAIAINEVSLLRQTHNAAHLAISVNDKLQLEQLVCDGVLVATPVGSTAYNLSAHGPIIPLGGALLALTPISPFRPRRWRGALLSDRSRVVLDVLDHKFRPVSASADSAEVRRVTRVVVEQADDITINLLYDPGFSLSDRATREQFVT